VLGITDEDVAIISEEHDSADLDRFADYVVFYPMSMTDARAAAAEQGMKILSAANSAIQFVCPFVDDAVRIEGDPRHSADQCPPTENPRLSRSKSHFIWAFAHLAEALAYYSVLLYQEEGNEKANIE